MNPLFFKLAFRSILKNRISSSINIIGFSIGVAASLFIFLFLKYELSFDTFYPNAKKIYRIVGTYKSNNNTSTTGFMWYPIAKDIKNEIAGVTNFCRVSQEYEMKCFVENQRYKIDKLRFVEPNFFSFFGFQLLAGNPKTALNSTDKIVLTQKKAAQLFGTANPLGKTILYEHRPLTVSGIAANPPSNTHLVFNALISSKYLVESDAYFTGYNGGVTLLSYLQLSDKATVQQIESAFPGFFDRKINRQWKEYGMSLSATLQNISNIHLSDGSIDDDITTNRSKKSIFVIISISILILLLAIINYIILYTAQKITKTKDIGILKVFGANNHSLLRQNFIEVCVLTTIASIIGVFLLFLGISFLNQYLQTTIRIEDTIFLSVLFLVILIIGLSIAVTFISSRKYSVVTTAASLKNMMTTSRHNTLNRNLLASFQFTVVMVLLIAVFVISRQNKFLQQTALGFDKENILTLQTDEEITANKLFEFKQNMRELAAINAVSLSSQLVGKGITKNGYIIDNEKDVSMLNVLYTDADFINCFQIPLLSGRNFYHKATLDSNAVLINQQLAKRAGWQHPIDQKIMRNGTLKVIGVVGDFNFASLENNVQPMLIMSNPSWDGWNYSVVNIRYQTTDIHQLIAQIKKRWEDRFPETPVDISFLDNTLAANYKGFIAQQKIIGFFSAIAIFIAVIGLLGLTIFTTRARIKEIGVRKVNGATIKDILILLNANFLKWIFVAFVVATPIAYYTMRQWLANFAYKTTLHWWIFALAGIIVLAIAIVTISWQSIKAATENPVEILRNE